MPERPQEMNKLLFSLMLLFSMPTFAIPQAAYLVESRSLGYGGSGQILECTYRVGFNTEVFFKVRMTGSFCRNSIQYDVETNKWF
jgi:hypothetical protein